MSLTEAQKKDVMRRLIRKMFVEANQTATLTTEDVEAAFGKLDDFMSVKTAAQLNTAGRVDTTKTLLQNINVDLPEPFKSMATLEQKALLIAYWAMKTGGVI